jgi:hypothetical protein
MIVSTLLLVAVPISHLTPGSFCTPDNPDFKEFRYEAQVPVCVRNVTTERKDEIMTRYGLPVGDRYKYEIDHCIPLSMGGSNFDDNLWPQPRDEQNSIAKNKLVRELYLGLVRKEITYEYALAKIRGWCPAPK